MPRVKRGIIHVKKRRTLLKKAKGYTWGNKNLIKKAKETVTKAGVHAYFDRKKKKRTNRGLFQIKISAFVKEKGLSYSRFMDALKKNSILLDRKVLANLAENNQAIMEKIVEKVKKA